MTFSWTINDAYNDVIVGRDGKLAKIKGAPEVRQRTIIALRHYWQEYFLNVPVGMPWYELVLGTKDTKQAELLIRDTVLKVPGVISILNINSIKSKDRHVSFNIRIEVQGISGPSIEEIAFAIKIGNKNG